MTSTFRRAVVIIVVICCAISISASAYLVESNRSSLGDTGPVTVANNNDEANIIIQENTVIIMHRPYFNGASFWLQIEGYGYIYKLDESGYKWMIGNSKYNWAIYNEEYPIMFVWS